MRPAGSRLRRSPELFANGTQPWGCRALKSMLAASSICLQRKDSQRRLADQLHVRVQEHGIGPMFVAFRSNHAALGFSTPVVSPAVAITNVAGLTVRVEARIPAVRIR